jgi:hypothetical protein
VTLQRHLCLAPIPTDIDWATEHLNDSWKILDLPVLRYSYDLILKRCIFYIYRWYIKQKYHAATYDFMKQQKWNTWEIEVPKWDLRRPLHLAQPLKRKDCFYNIKGKSIPAKGSVDA